MKRLVLDIETNLAHNRIWLCVTKDIDTGEVLVWKEANSLLEYLKDTSLIVMHNGIGFDAYVLNRLWKTQISRRQVYDTLVVSRLLEPSREGGHSLAAWGKTLGSHKLDYRQEWLQIRGRSNADTPEGMEFDDPDMALMERYCIVDVEVTAKLYQYLRQALKMDGFSEESVTLEHRVAAIVSEQTRNGFKLDVPHATMLLADIKGKLADIYEAMQRRWPPQILERVSEKTGKRLKDGVLTFNPGSRQQIGDKLKELGWKPKKFTPTGQPIVDEAVLAEVDIPEAKIIADYLLYQKRIAQITSWIEALGDDGRVHGKVITNGAVTGRMTHHSPNMAQIPNAGSVYGPECRQCWTVDEGNVLVGCDASGLELRMLAHYMEDEEYAKAVVHGSSKDGSDVHTKNQRAAGLQTRDQAKTFIYAFLYGAGPEKIGSIVGGGATEGRTLINKFLQDTPALQTLRDKVALDASKGMVQGLDGRKIRVRHQHAALNSLLQGAGAVVMKKALVMLSDRLAMAKIPHKFVANVHDEFQIECPEAFGDKVGKTAVDCIRKAGSILNLNCPLDGEYKIGKNWRETH